MTDPYKVLGVSESASDEEIKQAYRKLVRKYHPDQFTDHPLKELAEEKLKTINQAYDEVQKMRAGGGGAGGPFGGGGAYNAGGPFGGGGNPFSGGARAGGQSANSDPRFNQVRDLINRGDLISAEAALMQITARGAEWHYLYGVICTQRGWYDRAINELTQAVNMDPGNAEYAQFLHRVQAIYTQYGQRGFRQGAGVGPNACDVCNCLLCSDCCCECMGGDLIPCC